MSEQIIRTSVKEKKQNYFISYEPADTRGWLAHLHLVYVNESIDLKQARMDMEEEFNFWIQKYPIPLMTSAFNHAGELIRVGHLTGFNDSTTGNIFSSWELLKDKDFPEYQKKSTYQNDIYKDIEFKMLDSKNERIKFLKQTKILKSIILLYGTGMIALPLIIELIAMGIGWLNWLIILGGWSVAIFKLAKLYGYIQPSKYEVKKNEKESKMAHYFYHCERNPRTFEMLRNENFEQEQIKNIKSEFEKFDD